MSCSTQESLYFDDVTTFKLSTFNYQLSTLNSPIHSRHPIDNATGSNQDEDERRDNQTVGRLQPKAISIADAIDNQRLRGTCQTSHQQQDDGECHHTPCNPLSWHTVATGNTVRTIAEGSYCRPHCCHQCHHQHGIHQPQHHFRQQIST